MKDIGANGFFLGLQRTNDMSKLNIGHARGFLASVSDSSLEFVAPESNEQPQKKAVLLAVFAVIRE